MSAFRTLDAGVCAANCGQPIEVGDLVVVVNDEVVHLDCENPERAIAAALSFDVGDDLVRAFALAIANAVDASFDVAEVTTDEALTEHDLAIAANVLRSPAAALLRAEGWDGGFAARARWTAEAIASGDAAEMPTNPHRTP